MVYIRHISLISESKFINKVIDKQCLKNRYKKDVKSRAQLSLLGIGSTLIITSILIGFGIGFGDSSPVSTASRVFNNKTMDLTGKVKNLIILIPNEAHESPLLPKEQRLINQPYVPQNIIVSPGTNIVWFNGDVGHTRKITLMDEKSNQVFDSGIFEFNTASKSVNLNKTGIYNYSQANVNKDDPNFLMEGTITVKGDVSTFNPNDSNATLNTVASLMVPSKDSIKHVSALKQNGVDIMDQFTFKDLRGGQKGTGPEQTLLLIRGNSANDLISSMKGVTSTLPYS